MKNRALLAITTIIISYLLYNLTFNTTFFGSLLLLKVTPLLDLIQLLGLFIFFAFVYKKIKNSTFQSLKYSVVFKMITLSLLALLFLYQFFTNYIFIDSYVILNSLNVIATFLFLYFLITNKELMNALKSASNSEYKNVTLGILSSMILLLMNIGTNFFSQIELVSQLFFPVFNFVRFYIFPLALLPFFISIYNSKTFIKFFSPNEIDNPEDEDWVKFILIRLGILLLALLILALFLVLIYDGLGLLLVIIGIGVIIIAFVAILVETFLLLRKKLWKKFYMSLTFLIVVIYIILNIPL